MFKLRRFFTSERLKSVFDIKEEIVVNSKKFSFNVQLKTERPGRFLTIQNNQVRLGFRTVKSFHKNRENTEIKKDEVDEYDEKQSLMYYIEFEKWKERNKKTFLKTVKMYSSNVKNRAGHVDFIKAALKNMEAHGVHKDLECYKKIVDVLPKGVYVIKNIWMAAGMYFPRQQNVILDLLHQMGNNGVFPDAELGLMLINIFGRNSRPSQMFEQMLYWSLKWKNRSPFYTPRPLPSDVLQLAKIAIERITSVDLQTEVSVFQTNEVKDSIDHTWIVSGQSPKQKKLLAKHSCNVPVVVEGSNVTWLGDQSINYFILKADGNPLPFLHPEDTNDISNLKSKFFNPNYVVKKESPSVHEQDDGIIYAVCATGTSSKDSLLSWIRILENKGNAVLGNLPVLFRLHEKEKLPASYSEDLVLHRNK